METSEHIPVLLAEAVAALEIAPNGRYLDATFGRGGHSSEILAQLGESGQLYALDRDQQAAAVAAQITDPRFHFARCAFSEMKTAFAALGAESLDGILFDLGVSSPQLDDPSRGFSFAKEGPLDMRMDNEQNLTAQKWLKNVDEDTLTTVIRDYGGEPHTVAKRIAKAILAAKNDLKSTLDLASVVAQARPKKLYKPHLHPATQTFQAIRIAVNDEIGEIQRALRAATMMLKSGGILVVISFHGLEDATVKRFVRSMEGEPLPAEIPATNTTNIHQVLRLVPPVIKPSSAEIAQNPRSRSAKLRKAVKL